MQKDADPAVEPLETFVVFGDGHVDIGTNQWFAQSMLAVEGYVGCR